MENICQKTPLQNTWHRARGTPWKEIIFQLSCFSIYHNNAQWLSCTALPFDGCRNCCSCLHCQICWASASRRGPGQFWLPESGTCYTLATRIWFMLHTGLGPLKCDIQAPCSISGSLHVVQLSWMLTGVPSLLHSCTKLLSYPHFRPFFFTLMEKENLDLHCKNHNGFVLPILVFDCSVPLHFYGCSRLSLFAQ